MNTKMKMVAAIICMLTGTQLFAQQSKPCFLTISDIHLDSSLAVTCDSCESGADLWRLSKQKMEELIDAQKPSFIMLLGDLPWHAERTIDSELQSAKANTGLVLRELREIATQKQTTLLYVPGNNDSQDGDYASFTATNGQTPFMLDVLGYAAWPVIKANNSELGDTSRLYLGCYAAYPLGKQAKLKVIVLNTVINTLSGSNPYYINTQQSAIRQPADAAAQMDWFNSQLTNISDTPVLIAMHVPPGQDPYSSKNFWSTNFTWQGNTVQDAFYNIVAQYQQNIVGILSSHTHNDGVKILTDACKKFTAINISAPSITPDHRNNPGIKIFSYQPGNYALTDFTVYYNPLTPAAPTTFSGQYTFSNTFGSPAGTTIKDFLNGRYPKYINRLAEKLGKIYMVYSTYANNNNMKVAILAKYQQQDCKKD